MLKRIALLLMIGLIAGCSGTAPTPGPNPTPLPTPQVNAAVQSTVNAGVAALAGIGCKLIPATSDAAAIIALDAVQQALSGGPGAAMTQLESLSTQPGIGYIWSAIHAVLDALNWLNGQAWLSYADGAIESGVTACLAVVSA